MNLAAAVASDDAARLTRVPGIGKKTAERLILELRDKLPSALPAAKASAPPSELSSLHGSPSCASGTASPLIA